MLSCVHGDEQIYLKVSVNEALEFIIESSFVELPVVHQLCKKHRHRISESTLHWLLREIFEWSLYYGMQELKRY